jgi:hypothetical protein
MDPLIPNENNKFYDMEIFQEAPAVGSFKTGSPKKNFFSKKCEETLQNLLMKAYKKFRIRLLMLQRFEKIFLAHVFRGALGLFFIIHMLDSTIVSWSRFVCTGTTRLIIPVKIVFFLSVL